jgi:hypothetical protein
MNARLRGPAWQVAAIVTAWKLVTLFLLVFGAVKIASNPSIHVPYDHPALLRSTMSWDGGWYSSIATHGYGDVANPRLAFFPLFPIGVGEISKVLGVDILIVGFIINTIATYVAAWYLFLLARDFLKSHQPAILAVTLFLFFPTAFFLTAFYSEAIFCALAFAAFWYARQRKWWLACLLLAPLTATRLPGMAVALGVFIEYWSSRQFSLKRIDRHVLWFAIAPLGLLIYLLYQYLTFGSPLTFLQVYKMEWPYQRFDPLIPKTVLKEVVRGLRFTAAHDLGAAFDKLIPTVAWLGTLGLILKGIKQIPVSYTVFALSSLALFSLNDNLVSSNRYILPLFPIFLLLAHYLRGIVLTVWLAVSATLMGALLLTFGALYWVG